MRPLKMFAQVQPGLEKLALQELLALGQMIINPKIVKGGVTFSGHNNALYCANLHLRTASRILVRIGSFTATQESEFVNKLKHLDWENYAIENGTRFESSIVMRNCRLYHTGMLNNLKKTALGKYDVEGDHVNTQRVIISGQDDRITVSLDSSGEHLHKRFYRQNELVKMPIRETLVAGFLKALFQGGVPNGEIIDPFCGSGTLLIEAALVASNTAPGLVRLQNLEQNSFSFQRWPSYQSERLQAHVDEAEGKIIKAPTQPLFRGSDRDHGIVQTALLCSQKAKVSNWVHFEHAPLMKANLNFSRPGLIFTNPPWGIRSGDKSLRRLYAAFGEVVRKHAKGSDVAVITPRARTENNLLWTTGLKGWKNMLESSSGGRPVALWHCHV